jgi:itaconate CoA-transferase
MTSGPLAGVTVVALEQAVSAPMCTRTLGDLGARVIKVENPAGGDFARHYDDVVHGQAAHFVWLNRGKESVTLHLKSAEGLEVLHRLLATADVLVSNLTPGSTERLGLGPGDLETRHPHLIALEIDGYGDGGPLSHKRAYDLLVQAEAGGCAITGFPGMPAKAGPAVADITTGLYSAISIMGMLRVRDRDGATSLSGATVSLFDSMTELMGFPLTFTQASGADQEPRGMGSFAVAPYGAYPTADGQTVVLGTTNDREWQRLSRDLLGRADLAEDPRYADTPGRMAHADALDEAITGWTSEHELAFVQEAADAVGIGNSRLNRPGEVVHHPHLEARDRWRTIQTPGGPVRALLPPPVIDGYEMPMGAVPALGEHTDTVLAEIGLRPDEIEKLREMGAVGPHHRHSGG